VTNVSFYYFWSSNCGFVFGLDFFKKFSGGEEMSKVHGKIIFTQNGLSIQKL
jgi:hypothetical protein